MQRRLINALEDLKVMQDGSVRNTAGTIIQFNFGDDGIDPSRGINGKAADIDDILFQLLGDRDDIDLSGKLNVVSYGSLERDMDTGEEVEEVEIETEE
jgi:DNA-directed RNA polymerase subunit A'